MRRSRARSGTSSHSGTSHMSLAAVWSAYRRSCSSIDAQDEHGSSHPIIILVSLPPTYPASAPPQLQLLSRYIGPYGVDAPLFGTVLRTYISRGAVEWTPGSECVFDGLEWVKERCTEWLSKRMSEKKVGEVLREDEKTRAHEEHRTNDDDHAEGNENGRQARSVPDVPAEMPPGITIVEAESIHDRKSAFVGRACPITDPSHVGTSLFLDTVGSIADLHAFVGPFDPCTSHVRPQNSKSRPSHHQCMALSCRKCSPSRYVLSTSHWAVPTSRRHSQITTMMARRRREVAWPISCKYWQVPSGALPPSPY